jgi:hypothetical protein
MLDQAARLDRERPLYGPSVGEHLHVNLDWAAVACASASALYVEASKSVNFEFAILNVCSAFIANTCS